MRMTVDLLRSPEGRLQGTLVTEAGDRYPFAGTLDLLRVLEALEPGPRGGDHERRGGSR